MNKDFNDFYEKAREAVMKAVRLGGGSNVYINNNLEIWVTNATKSMAELSGWNVIYAIECKSSGDLSYNKEEDFVEADAEYHYLDAIVDDLEELFKDINLLHKVSVD